MYTAQVIDCSLPDRRSWWDGLKEKVLGVITLHVRDSILSVSPVFCRELQRRQQGAHADTQPTVKVLRMSEVWRRYIHTAVEAQLRDRWTASVVVLSKLAI